MKAVRLFGFLKHVQNFFCKKNFKKLKKTNLDYRILKKRENWIQDKVVRQFEESGSLRSVPKSGKIK